MSDLRFLNSGLYGDLIYALWAIKKVGGGKILFNMSQGSLCYPLACEFAKSLLLRQSYITGVETIEFPENLHNNTKEKMFCRQDVNNPDLIILDNAWFWRTYEFHWIYRYAHMLGVQVDPTEKVLDVEIQPLPYEERPIIVQLTDRYRTRNNDEYEALLSRPDVIQFKEGVCKDLLEMATLIANAKFFVGNSTSGSALAQALRIPYMMETHPYFEYSYPIGENTLVIKSSVDDSLKQMEDISRSYWGGT